jgi:hypothetical protein
MFSLQSGGVIGGVLIVADHPSRWFEGPMGLVLADAREEPFRPVKDQLGLLKVR